MERDLFAVTSAKVNSNGQRSILLDSTAVKRDNCIRLFIVKSFKHVNVDSPVGQFIGFLDGVWPRFMKEADYNKCYCLVNVDDILTVLEAGNPRPVDLRFFRAYMRWNPAKFPMVSSSS